jgi:hypothetical protein
MRCSWPVIARSTAAVQIRKGELSDKHPGGQRLRGVNPCPCYLDLSRQWTTVSPSTCQIGKHLYLSQDDVVITTPRALLRPRSGRSATCGGLNFYDGMIDNQLLECLTHEHAISCKHTGFFYRGRKGLIRSSLSSCPDGEQDRRTCPTF